MNSINRSQPHLGTCVDIHITAPLSDNDLLVLSTQAYAEIARIHNTMSFHEDASELSKINSLAHKRPVEISSCMHTVLLHALTLSALTEGAYDITVARDIVKLGGLPERFCGCVSASWQNVMLTKGQITFTKSAVIDLGGIAKGYAVDCAANSLMEAGLPIEQFVINAGGDIRMLKWNNQHINIRHPDRKTKDTFLELPMLGPAVATSAPHYTAQHSLIMDPKTREPVPNTDSVSVFAPTCMAADALTKVAIMDTGCASILKTYSASAVSIDTDGFIFFIQ